MFLKGKYNYVTSLVQTMKKRSKPTHLHSVKTCHLPQSFLNYHSVCRRKRKRRRVTQTQKVPFSTEMKRMKMKARIVRKEGKAKEKLLLQIKPLVGLSKWKMNGNRHLLPSSQLMLDSEGLLSLKFWYSHWYSKPVKGSHVDWVIQGFHLFLIKELFTLMVWKNVEERKLVFGLSRKGKSDALLQPNELTVSIGQGKKYVHVYKSMNSGILIPKSGKTALRIGILWGVLVQIPFCCNSENYPMLRFFPIEILRRKIQRPGRREKVFLAHLNPSDREDF